MAQAALPTLEHRRKLALAAQIAVDWGDYQSAGVLIDLLDELDGDPDVEPNGDESDMSYRTQDDGVVAYCTDSSDDDEETRHRAVPIYGLDHTRPPTSWHG